MNIVIACSKQWFNYDLISTKLDENSIYVISEKDQLNANFLEKLDPRYIFFPHWNWIVPDNIFNMYECILFHTAPLPFGRGGSPIQNLIRLGYKSAPVCAIKMSEVIDGGPVYLRKEVALDGNISDIFTRINPVINEMILDICKNQIIPIPQEGEVFEFNRLQETDNELQQDYSISQLYDHIRMVDGLDYPKAHIFLGDKIIEFHSAELKEGELNAKVKITSKDN
jgi:methionyl-tRNA formyltransferase|tara:strand:+ start:6401 stop:7075 length:675 start_codon:yes stop_codon:yes gene_type:complete